MLKKSSFSLEFNSPLKKIRFFLYIIKRRFLRNMIIKNYDKCSWCGKEIRVTEEGNNLCKNCAQFPARWKIISKREQNEVY